MPRLDDPNLRPGETEEQRQKRLVKAAKWTKIATDARGQANRSALASRMIRLIFLVVCGIALTGAGIYNFSDPSETKNTQGFGNQHFGPHGNAVCITLIGLIVVALAVYFLVRQIRRLRSLPPLGTPNA